MRPSINEALDLLSYLPKRPDYETWIKIISAIGNTFPEQTALNLLLSHFQDEKPNETAIKLKNRLKNITYATLVYLAKQFGFRPDKKQQKTVINRYRDDFSKQGIIKHRPARKNNLDDFKHNPELIYKFADLELEERASIYEYEAGLQRFEADESIFNEFPGAERERLYRVAINRTVLNKNLNPKTKQPNSDFSSLTNNWSNEPLTLNQLIDNISKGFAFMPCWINGTIRKTEYFLFAEIFCLDIDAGLTISEALKVPETRKALFIYTTCNHTESNHRFRIVFPLPRLIRDVETYKTVVSSFIEVYNADKNCKDPIRAFFGNDKAIIYNIQTGEIKGGNL